MSNAKPKNDSIVNQEFSPVFDLVPGLNTKREDYKLLENKPDSSSGRAYALFDFWATAGAAADGTYREVIFGGTEGDMQVAYTGFTLLTGLGTVDYTLTRKSSGVTITGNAITVPGGKTCKISCYPTGANYLVRFFTSGGSIRYLERGSLDFPGTTGTVSFINASASDLSLTVRFATGAAVRPIFGFLVEIF